jgi:hypothetical protein
VILLKVIVSYEVNFIGILFNRFFEIGIDEIFLITLRFMLLFHHIFNYIQQKLIYSLFQINAFENLVFLWGIDLDYTLFFHFVGRRSVGLKLNGDLLFRFLLLIGL